MAKTLTIYLAADLKKLNSGLKDAQGGFMGLGNSLSSMLGPALIGAAAAAGALAVKLGVDGVKAAMDDQVAAEKLAQTMENLGLAHDTQAVEDFIYQLERSLGIADTELRPAYDRLVRSIGDTTKAQEILKLSLDVSAGSGKSLQQVTDALGRAYDGNIAGLTRLGAGIDAATVRTGDMELITRKLSETFAGQAQTSASTLEGQLGRVTTATDNLKEAFGAGLINALGQTDRATTGFVRTLEAWEPTLERIGNQLGLMAEGAFILANNLELLDAPTETANNESQNWLDTLKGLFGEIQLGLPLIKGFNGVLTVTALQAQATAYVIDTARDSFTRFIAAAGAASDTMSYGTVAGDRYTEMAKALGAEIGFGNRGLQRYNAYLEEAEKATTKAGGATKKTGDALDDTKTKWEAQAEVVRNAAAALTQQANALDAARSKITDYVNSMTERLTSGYNLGDIYKNSFDEQGRFSIQAFMQGAKEAQAQSSWFGDVLNAVKAEPEGQAFADYLSTFGAEVGGGMGQAMLDAGLLPTFIEQFNAVQTEAEKQAQSLVPHFLQAGVDSALQMLAGTADTLKTELGTLNKIGRNAGKVIGAGLKQKILEDVASAVREAEAAGAAARAEKVAQVQAQQAALTQQAVAEALSRIVTDANNRAGFQSQPVI